MTMNMQAPSDEACLGTPQGTTIAQLVQKQQQMLDDDDSNYSEDEVDIEEYKEEMRQRP